MRVQTVIYGNSYGSHSRQLCDDCSGTVYLQMQDNIRGSFTAFGDWHAGTCDDHTARQTVTERMARNMGAR